MTYLPFLTVSIKFDHGRDSGSHSDSDTTCQSEMYEAMRKEAIRIAHLYGFHIIVDGEA